MPELREQKRAQAALAKVKAFRGRREEQDVQRELLQLPSRIQASGLGQTLAFFASKGGAHAQVGDVLGEFLGPGKKTIDYLEQIMNGDAAAYRRATREALAYAEWLKRYGKALLTEGEGGGR
jgi:CRISPR-associated protein Cmr5